MRDTRALSSSEHHSLFSWVEISGVHGMGIDAAVSCSARKSEWERPRGRVGG